MKGICKNKLYSKNIKRRILSTIVKKSSSIPIDYSYEEYARIFSVPGEEVDSVLKDLERQGFIFFVEPKGVKRKGTNKNVL